MYTFIIVLICIAAVLLVLVVLAQNPKSGMAANFASSNQVMGVRQTADFLEKFTWGLAIAIVVLSLLASVAVPSNANVNDVDLPTLNLNQNTEGLNTESLPLNSVGELPLPAAEEAAPAETTQGE